MATLTYFGWEIPDPFSATYEDLWGYVLNTLFANMDEFMHHQYEFTHDLGNISGALAVDLENGTYQHGILTGNVTSLTVSNIPSGRAWFFTLELNQDGTGGRTFTADPSTYKRNEVITLSTAANAIDFAYFRGRSGAAFVDLAKGYA